MSNEPRTGPAARGAGLARIRTLTRAAVVGAALLSAAFAGLAAASTHVRKATTAATQSVRRTTTATVVPTPVPAPAPSSAVPAAPAQAPAATTAPPVVSSGGS
jgi:hypothetical protein